MTDSQQPHISGILLAAGLSTRMGEPKQLLPFADSTIVETVVDNMLDAKFSEVIVVVGHYAEQIQELISDLSVKTVFNPDYHKGMLTSVQAGVRSLNFPNENNSRGASTFTNRNAFALLLVDQPFITSALIDIVIDTYTHTTKGIVLPSYNYRRGHPVIFNQKYVDEILSLSQDSDGVRTLYKTHSKDIHYVEVDTDAVLRDIDYKEDYERALKENN